MGNATKCEITLVGSNYESRHPGGNRKKFDKDPQICILEGSRLSIERCLELINEKFPPEQYPEFSTKQINLPSQEDQQHCNEESGTGMSVSLPPSQLTNVTITAIDNTGHIFFQIPENPTFMYLQRLEQCMLNVYERLQHRIPKVPQDLIQVGLVSVAKFDDKYYRLQIVSHDTSTDCCEVKFLDYGGFDMVQVSELWQIRQDFMSLPFQAVECFLSNVIPPATCSEWPFESIVHLEELTREKNISCRSIGMTEESIPIVQVYSSSINETSGEIETRFVNKELVERGAAQWVEHSEIDDDIAASEENDLAQE